MFDPSCHPHSRLNPLTQSLVLCSPHRAQRPWLGQEESLPLNTLPEYISDCYLCPRNKRVGAKVNNPDYASTFTFDNDFPALKESQPACPPDALGTLQNSSSVPAISDPSLKEIAHSLLKTQGIRGICRVICFSPKHNLTMAQLSREQILAVIRAWTEEYASLSQNPVIHHVQIFENKGAVMGCSNPHPHGQIWATEEIPEEPRKELASLAKYKLEKGSCMLCDYALLEIHNRSRLVCENDSFVCVVPFWAVWPFETMIVSKGHLKSLLDFEHKQQVDLADILSTITVKYDNLFQCSFPYSMGIHQAPSKGDSHAHFHMHFYPPLLRSATVKKFLVGYVILHFDRVVLKCWDSLSET